jgi:orotate phosphoribosyltransferase
MTDTDYRNALLTLIAEKSYLTGDFTLTSGEKSKHFFDIKRTVLDPQGAKMAAELILDRFAETPEIDAVGGLVIGACPLVSAICVRSAERERPLPSFYVRKEPKKHGTRNQIEGLDLKEGMKIAVVDDVATKGGSMLEAIREIEKFGCEIVRTMVLVDRQQGATDILAKEGYRLESIFTAADIRPQ